MPLTLTVVTMEREVYSADDVERVIVPASEGVMGILPRHEPILSALKEGELEIVRPGKRDILAISGGFIEVRGLQVIVMADMAEQSDEIDVARAERARAEALEALAKAPAQAERLDMVHALRRAETRIKVARRHRGDSVRM
ncbi:MAG: ATP synthase F1 subunit epsilon [Ardenticatenales bacterium]